MKRLVVAGMLLAFASAALAQPGPPHAPPTPPTPPSPPTPYKEDTPPRPPKPPKPPKEPHVNVGGHGGWTESATASQSVPGVVTVRVKAMTGDVDVVAGAKGTVKATISDANASKVTIEPAGAGRYEVLFDGRKTLRNGDVRLEVPRGTHIEVITLSGEVTVRGVGGNVRLKTTSGDISADDVAQAILLSISGEITVKGLRGQLQSKTVSGDLQAHYNGGAPPKVRFQSTSGNFEWHGLCGGSCKLDVETLSADITLMLDPKSSFALRFESRSGDLSDKLGLTIDKKPTRAHPPGDDDDDDFDDFNFDDDEFDLDGTKVTGRYGKGEGAVNVNSFSGDLYLKKP